MPAVAPRTEPLESVLRSFDVIPEMAKLVVVALVVVLFCAVKFWRVVEPTTNRLPAPLNEEVAVVPK